MSRKGGQPQLFRFEWERVIRSVVLPSNAKLVALTLATYADPAGNEAYPGTDRLVDDTGLSESSVRRSLSRLREVGLVERVSEGSRNGRRALADVYRLVIPEDLLDRVDLVSRVRVSPVRQTGDPDEDQRSQGPVIGQEHRSHRPGSPVTQTGTPVTGTGITGHSDTPPDHDQPMHQPMTNPPARVEQVRTDRARVVPIRRKAAR